MVAIGSLLCADNRLGESVGTGQDRRGNLTGAGRIATIDRHYFAVCTRGAAWRGIDTDALLRAAGIDPVDVTRAGWRGDAAAMARLVRGVVAALGDEHMGYTASTLPPGAFAFAAGLAFEGATVRDGLARAIRFYALAGQDVATRLADRDGAVAITVRLAEPERDPDLYFRQFRLMSWHRLACWLAGETVPMLGASFAYAAPATYRDEFARLFPCPHRYGAEADRITVDAHALAGPIRRTRAELEAMVSRAPFDIMTIPASDASWSRRVRLALARDAALDYPALARTFAIGAETLRKRLRREGTSLAAIRDAWRRETALRALSHGTHSIDAIAAELGYAEARSFTRAFRSWTGTSPTGFRRRVRGQGA